MHEPTYRQALQRSFDLVYRHKTVWIFGVLSLLIGQLGWNNFIGGMAVFPGQEISVRTYVFNFPWETLLSRSNWFWSIWLVIVIAALVALVVFLAVASEGALVAAGAAWFKGEKNLSVDAAWQKGVKHFPRLLGLHLIKKVLLISLLIFTNGLLISMTTNFLALAFVMTVAILLALVISTVGIFATAYVVDRELPFVESITRAGLLFHEHLLVSLELSLILLAVQIAVVLLFIFASIWFLVPFVAIVFVAGFTGHVGLILSGLWVSLILALLAAALVGGILNAFSVSAWMYLFKKMDHEGVGSRIVHWIKK